MKNYYDRTWKIGELAKVFDVNVQLLRHYDKEGLLVPDIRNPDNKWRTYRYDQIYSLGMIRFLRYLDCSLEEIGDFMVGRNAQSTEAFLDESMERTREKYEKLLRMESVVKDRFVLIKNDLPYAESDQVFIYSEDEIHYIESGGLEDVFADELFYLYPTLVFYKDGETKFAVKIPPEDAGEYRDRVCQLPPSDYLVGFHHGSYDNIDNTFEKMRKSAGGLLDERDILGDEVMTINLIDQLVEENRDNYLTKVMMKVNHSAYGMH